MLPYVMLNTCTVPGSAWPHKQLIECSINPLAENNSTDKIKWTA